jgi:hypothetical protein
MRKFDNISALENISLDSDYQHFEGQPNQAIALIIATYTALKNLNSNGYVIAVDEPEYESYFNANKLSQAPINTLYLMANEVETIGNAYSSNSYGQSTLKKSIDNFRAFAQKYYPNLKNTYYFQEKARYDLVESLPQEYKDIYKEPFYSENLSQNEKVDMAGELRGVAVRADLSLGDKKSLAMDIIKMYIPSLPSSSGSIDLSTTEEERAEGATTDSKINIAKYAIIGGVLVVGGIATWLILRKK